VEWLQVKALSSSPSTAKKKRKKKNNYSQGWRCSSLVDCMFSMRQAPDSFPSSKITHHSPGNKNSYAYSLYYVTRWWNLTKFSEVCSLKFPPIAN
jgi:hypothetical protein